MLILSAILQNPEIYEDAQLNKTVRSCATMTFLKVAKFMEVNISVMNTLTLIK